MTPQTGPFTELNSRRLGPVRRFFVRRPRAMDAVVVALFAIAVLASEIDPAQAGNPGATALIAVVGSAALLLRRDRPLLVAGVLAGLAVVALAWTGGLAGLELGIGFALYAVAVARPQRTTWIAAGAILVLTALAVALWEEPSLDPTATIEVGSSVVTDDRVSSITGLVIVTLAAIAIGIGVRNRREHLADLLERANAIARDRDRQAQLARAEERSRIAREMHDVVAHSLSVMITLADGATAALDRAPDRSRAALGELSATGRAALGDMRRVLGALSDGDAPLEPTGEGQDLDTLVERFRAAGLPVRAEGVREPMPDDTGLRLAVYRVVQEALTNVLRHAPGTERVDLAVRPYPDRWEIEIVDQGAVLPVGDAGGAGLGLIGMRERVEVLGGTVEAGASGRGWRVHVELPAGGRR
ncbi:histidine kinase [Actinotalea sp. M2MS4P-6]|uniref:sensor histidine kinase n=1 Tax=Actinotalea sp. M2MS4P-6 TaxID=2983762 RepID=UPI0021E4D00D|nr:histidine kinase [Actinotalea sp. M2MS4P-6]MCV2396515.1 histidine kinase [Actinotalea sp. M2MS4P-6]